MELSRTIETETGEMIVKRVSVPLGLEELMEGLAKEVILKKPKDIYVFASEYFTKLLHLRDSGLYRGNVRSAKLAVKQPSKAVIVGRNIFSPSNSDHSSKKNIDRKPSTPYYLNHSEGSAKKTDEMRRSRIREHLRKKKEEHGLTGNTTEIHSSIANENSETSSKDIKLMHKSRPLTRNRRSISENKTKPEEKYYERTRSLREGTRMHSKNRDISLSIQKKNNNNSSAKKTNSGDSKQKSPTKKSATNSSTDMAKKESPRNLETSKSAPLDVDQNTEIITKLATSIDFDNSNNKAGNISSIQDEKGQYEVSYNPELIASDREDNRDSSSFLSSRKDSRVTENNETNDSTENNESVEKGYQKPHEEELDIVDTELKHENGDDASDLIEHQDFPPVNDPSELEAALTIQKLWRGFQSRKKTNDNQKNTSSTFVEDGKRNCMSQPLRKSQISEKQTVTSEDENGQDINDENKEKKKDEIHDIKSITPDTCEKDDQKKDIQNGEFHCDNEGQDGMNKMKNEKNDSSSVKDPSESDTERDVLIGGSSDFDKGHEKEYKMEAEEGKENESSSCDQVPDSKETTINSDASEETNVNKNEEVYDENDSLANGIEKSSDEKTPEMESIDSSTLSNEEHKKPSFHQQAAEDLNTCTEIISEHENTSSENEGIYHTIVTDLNNAIKSSPLIQNGKTKGEDHLKPEEVEEPSSTLLSISQEDLSEKNSKNSPTNEAAIHDENKNEDNGMEQQTSTLSEKDSEGKLPTTSSDTVLSLDNTHGSYSMSEGSDETETSNHSVIVNNKIDTSNLTGLNSQVVNEKNRVSTEDTEDDTKCVESPNGNEVIQSDEIDLHDTDVIETSNGEKACSTDDIGNGPDTELRNGDELLSTSSDNEFAETELTKNYAISLEHSEEKSKEETEKDALKSSSLIEDSSSEGCDESPHDAENYVADNQENASAPIESNKIGNWNEFTSKKVRDDADAEEYSKSTNKEDPISTTDHLNISNDHETEQQDYKTIKEFTNELNADKENDIIDAQESSQSKEGHEQLATLSNSFHDAASDRNVSKDHVDNSFKNSEENRCLPAENAGHSEETILASTPELHELKEIENSDSSLCEKKEDYISDILSSNMPEETSNDTSNSVHDDRVTISEGTEDNANVNEYQNDEKEDLSPDNSTKDHESSKPKEHLSDQQQEDNSLKTTAEVPEHECSPSNNSISESQIIDSQNIHDNKAYDMEKEGQKAVQKETGSTETNEDITNDDISKVIQNNEVEDEPIIPETSSSQKDNQVDMKENDAENLSELNVALTSMDGDNNEPKEEISSGAEESTIPNEIDADDKTNSGHMKQIISTRNNDKILPNIDKKVSKETDDNFRSLEESIRLGSKSLQLHQINTEDPSKIAKKESKNRIIKKRSYSYRQENEQQEKSKSNKPNIRRVKSQETTSFRNQNRARRNSVSPEKHLSGNVSKNSVNNAISREVVKEPLIIPKNIVPNGSIHEDMKSTLDDKSPKTDERIESEMTPTDSTEEKRETSNTEIETNNEINHSEEGEFIVEDTKGSMKKKSDNDVDDAISESYTRDHENHDQQLKLAENNEFSKELNEKRENVVLKEIDDSDVKKTDVLDEEMQKDIQESKEIIIENDVPHTMAVENSDDRVIDSENNVENVLILKSNNADIQQEDKMKELKVSTTPSDSIELNNGKYSNLYPDEEGASAEEHVSEKKIYNAIAEQRTQEAGEKLSPSEIKTNMHHEKVEESGEEMINGAEPGSIEKEIEPNAINVTEIVKEDLDQHKMNNTDVMSISEPSSDQDVDNKELNTSNIRTNSTDESEKEIPSKNATDEEIIHSLIGEGSSVNNDELNGKNFETSNKDNGDHISQSNEFNVANLVDMNEVEHNSEELTTTRNIHLAETDITGKQMGSVKNQAKNDGHISQPEMKEITSKSTNIEHPLENAMHEEKNSSQEFIDREKRDSIKTESISNCENLELPEPTENNDKLKSMGTKNSELTHMKAVDGGILRNEIIEDVHNHEEISHPLSYAKLSTESSSNMKTDSEEDVDEELLAIEPAHSMTIDESTQNSEESSEEPGKLATRYDSLDSNKITESAKEVDEQNVKQNSPRKDGKQGQEEYKKISPDDTTWNLDEIESAINIQKTWRGFQARKKVGNIIENNKNQKLLELQEKLFEKGETDENRNILNSQDKNSLGISEPSTNSNNSNTNENNTKDKNLNDAGQDEITKAALKIQYSFRKFKTRKGRKFQRSALSHMDNETAKEYVNQALKIQSAWRAYKVRKNIREVEEKINEIENNSGNKLPKSIHLTDEEILKAVTKIQTNLRGYMSRKHFKNLLERNQSLDGIQEETNSESPNIKTNTTVSSDEDILNTLKQLDEVTIPSTPPEFVSGERIKRNVDQYAGNECTDGKMISSDSLNSSANTPQGNSSLNEMNCSSTSVSADTDSSNLPKNTTDQQICNTETQGSLKKSKATDDLVKLAEEFEYGEDSSKAIEHTLKTQKSLEENGSIQVSNMEDYSVPDKKLASFEIPDSDVDLDDPSKVSLDHESDSLHSEKSDTDEIDAGDPKVNTANCDIENNAPPKTSLEDIKRLTKSVDEFQQNFHIVDDFVNQKTTDRLEASPSKATDVRNSERTEKDEPSQILHDQKDNNPSSVIGDNSVEINCKKDFREDDGQINDSELEQFSLIDEKMPEDMSKNVENGDSLAQDRDGMKTKAISESKFQEISEIDDSAAPTQSIKAVSVDQEKKENRSIDLSNGKQAENTEAIENNFIPPLELQTEETNNANQQEEIISDNKSKKSTTFENKESDKDNEQTVTGNQKNNRLTLNDFMKKTLNLDQKVPADREVTKDDLTLNQKLPAEERHAKNENAQIEIDLKDNDDSTEAFEKNTMSEHQAAVKIQSIYRGYNSRKNTNNITKVSDDSDVVTTQFLIEKNDDSNEQHSEQNSAIKESVSAQQTTKSEGDFTKTDHPSHKNCTGDETPEKSSSVAVGIQTNVPPNTNSNTDEAQENVPGQVFVIIQVLGS